MDHDATASGHQSAPHCPNLIVRQWRFQEDLASLVRHKVEMVITSVGSPAASVGPLHDLGCLVFADIASLNHAEKAIKAGADGVVLDIEVTVTAEEAELQMMTRSKLTRSRGRANYIEPNFRMGSTIPQASILGAALQAIEFAGIGDGDAGRSFTSLGTVRWVSRISAPAPRLGEVFSQEVSCQQLIVFLCCFPR